MQNETKQAILHGECLIFQNQIPNNAKKEELSEFDVIIAPSETTGNHHLIERSEGVEFFTCEDGSRFIRNTKPTVVKCAIKERHDTVTIPPGEWQITPQQEFDYFEMAKRNVAD